MSAHRIVARQCTRPDGPTTWTVTCAPHGHEGEEHPDHAAALTETRERHVWGAQSRRDGTWVPTQTPGAGGTIGVGTGGK